MTVKRIVAHLQSDALEEQQQFYSTLFGLEPLMALDWIVTMGTQTDTPTQINLTRPDATGTPVPRLSIEVDDVDAIHARAQSEGFDVIYALTDESWGVRRFFLRDPAGHILNVLSHSKT